MFSGSYRFFESSQSDEEMVGGSWSVVLPDASFVFNDNPIGGNKQSFLTAHCRDEVELTTPRPQSRVGPWQR